MTNVELGIEGFENVVLTGMTKRQAFKEQAISRMGETKLNNTGSLMTIDEYNNSNDIWVRFIEKGNMVHTSYRHFVSGNVKDIYAKSVFGIGFLGEGIYKPKVNEKFAPQYVAWKSMLSRAYSDKVHEKRPTYIGVTVCQEWLCFQNFAKWYDENYYEIDNHKTHLEKDIISKNNKLYSPQTVIFVPSFINSLFTKRDSLRGEYYIGVRRVGKKYTAQCSKNKSEKIHLGTFDTPEEAFYAYKEFKEQLIKGIANEYEGRIPDQLFNAMHTYTVEIND